jgi:hypothetical protein
MREVTNHSLWNKAVLRLPLAWLHFIEYNTGCESERQGLSIEFTITCYSYAENREVNDAHPPF